MEKVDKEKMIQHTLQCAASFLGAQRTKLRMVLFLAVMMFNMQIPSYARETLVIKCLSGFAPTGACGVGGGQHFRIVSLNGVLSGSRVELIGSGKVHTGSALNYFARVGVQVFAATFTFVPNGQNVAFVLQNTGQHPRI